MKKITYLILMAVLIASMTGCEKQSAVNVSAAISLKSSLEEIEAVFDFVSPEYDVALNLGSSGALQAQIEEGAPVDVFFSAGARQMNVLEDKGFIKEGSRRSLLSNSLVVIVPLKSGNVPEKIEDLSKDSLKVISCGDPSVAPVGQYASEALAYYGITESISDKMVLAPDAKTTLSWVESGEADAGIVYMTDAVSSKNVKIAFVIDPQAHSQIEYPMAVINESANAQGAQAFAEFLESEAALDIFRKNGFS